MSWTSKQVTIGVLYAVRQLDILGLTRLPYEGLVSQRLWDSIAGLSNQWRRARPWFQEDPLWWGVHWRLAQGGELPAYEGMVLAGNTGVPVDLGLGRLL